MFGAFGCTDGNRIEMILRGEGVACVRAAQAGTDDAPRGGAGRKAIIDDDGLVGAMKRAKAEMHDARGDARTVVGRAADAGWQPVEIGAAEAHVVSPLVWPLLDMAPVLGQCLRSIGKTNFPKLAGRGQRELPA